MCQDGHGLQLHRQTVEGDSNACPRKHNELLEGARHWMRVDDGVILTRWESVSGLRIGGSSPDVSPAHNNGNKHQEVDMIIR